MSLPLITLTTDFGLEDTYVGVMKGIIYSINPAALPLDLTHTVAPQNVRQAAFLLSGAYRQFPPGTIHVAVVDPGVGTSRRAICLVIPEVGYLIGPDNGLFSYILYAEKERGAQLKAFELSNRAYHRPEVSRTFHGRDVFAPVAAYLSKGEPVENFGSPIPIENLVMLDELWPTVKIKDKIRTITGTVVHIDHFGNVISNIPGAMLGELTPDQRRKVRASCGYVSAKSLVETYGESKKGKLVVLVGSSGFVEIARVEGRADLFAGAEGSSLAVKLGSKFVLTVQ